jgi:NACHT domain
MYQNEGQFMNIERKAERRWSGIILLLLAFFVLVAGSWLSRRLKSDQALQSAANWAQLISVALAVLIPSIPKLAASLLGLGNAALDIPTDDQVNSAQRTLAGLLREQWDEEVRIRQLSDPAPMPVRWRLAESETMDHPSNVFKVGQKGSRHGTVSRQTLELRADRLEELSKKLERLNSRRLVILGDASTGKTTLAILLLHAMLKSRRHSDPIPLILSLEDWNPEKENLHTWIARRLVEQYPALRSRVFGPNVASALVKQGKLLPILDGLDEVRDNARLGILKALNGGLGGDDGLIVTCRTAEFKRVIRMREGAILRGAATIRPYPLSPADVVSYLERASYPNSTFASLCDALQKDPRGSMARVCANPLNLWLLRNVYLGTGIESSILLREGKDWNSRSIENHLLDNLISSLIRTKQADATTAQSRPFHPRRQWEPEKAAKWLSFLANHLQTENTHDLAWWRIWKAPDIRKMRNSFSFQVALIIFNVVLLARLPVMGLFGAWVDGLGVGAVMLIISRFSFKVVAEKKPAYVNLKFRRRLRLLMQLVRGNISIGFPMGAALGLLGWVAYSGVNGLGASWDFAPVLMTWFGLLVGTSMGIVMWAEVPQDSAAPATPITSFRRDARLTIFKFALYGISSGVAFGLAFGAAFGLQLGITSGIMAGIVFGLVWAVVVGSGGACVAYLISAGQLHADGNGPRRLLMFLEDARRLGILRTDGLVYQFRNSELRDRLAARIQD